MRTFLTSIVAFALASCAMVPAAVDSSSDAPDSMSGRQTASDLPASYSAAIGTWRHPSEVNRWDLSRFAVETLRAVAPSAKAAYLMIEFDPAVISGNTLRRHWVVKFERDGKLYFFADSKRPGHIAGPYSTVQEFIDQYSQYRQRRIVSYRALESHERQLKKHAPKASREERA